MKFLVCLTLLAVAAADVSHLFPGQHHHHHHVQHTVQLQPQYQQVQVQQVQPQYQQVQRSGYAEPIAILQQVQETSGLGDYKYSYETANGIKASSQAQLKNAGSQDEALVSEGTYSYVGDDGQTYSVNWVADEYGYRASGAHLPTPPPIPAEIQRSLEINAQEERQQPQKFF